MHHGMVRLGTLLVALVVAAIDPARIIAQEGTPAPSEITIQDRLFSARLETPPTETVFVTLSRFTFAPGASLSTAALLGSDLHYVEAGSLAARTAGTATHVASVVQTTGGPPALLELGTTVDLGPGDLLLVPTGVALELRNVGAEPATTLVVEFLPADQAVASQDGITRLRLAAGTVEMPRAPVAVELTRLTLPPFAITPPHQGVGPELLAVEAGECTLALHPGQVTIKRADGGEQSVSGGASDPLAQPEPDPEADPEADLEADPEADAGDGGTATQGPLVLQGVTAGLRAGDAALLAAGGVHTLQGVGGEPAIIMALVIAPANELAGSSVEATPTSPALR